MIVPQFEIWLRLTGCRLMALRAICLAESIYWERAVVATVYDEGRQAFMRGIDPRRCPDTDQARREAWMRGWNDPKQEFEAS